MRLSISLVSLGALAVLALNSTVSFASWDRILVCNDGKTWVDVDSTNRTRLQLVSRDSAANLYINKTLQARASFQGGDWGSYETVWTGSQSAGVFAPSDFQGATATSSSPAGYPRNLGGEWIDSYTEYASFYKIAGNKLKLQITRSNVQKCVNNSYYGRFGKCMQGTYSAGDQYVGDWVFENCQ